MSSRTTRYSTRVMARARELNNAGWPYPKVRKFLERELGVSPAVSTVERWCIPDALAEKRRAYYSQQAARARQDRPRTTYSQAWRTRRVRELFARGVSLKAIGQVSAVWWGEPLSEEQVMRRLGLVRGDTARLRRRAA